MLLLFISFVAGVLTVLAPCVLPLLPVIVGGSLSGNEVSKKRAFIVTISLGISVILFTLVLKVSTIFVMIPESFWQWISGGIILFFGLITLFPKIWEHISIAHMLNRESNIVIAQGLKKKSIWGDVIVGAALGPVFSSCSPTYFLVLATVLPESPVKGFIYLLTYTLGMCLMLLFVALVGQKIVEKLGIAADPKGWFKRMLGVLFIVVGLLIITGVEKQLELDLASSGYFDVTQIEQNLLHGENATPDNKIQIQSVATTTQSEIKKSGITFLTSAEKAAKLTRAPEITDPSGFINTGGQPITIGQFKGKKAVLIDIWTYSCINCQRTLPYVKSWYDKYNDKGLEIISIHTPEFSFEKVQKNVEAAVANEGIKYPVVMDNNYGTWNAFGNQYWPRKYLIDIDGYIIYDHAGEGDYDVTEKAIQYALTERSERLNIPVDFTNMNTSPKDVVTVDPSKVGSPEIYFGQARENPSNNVRLEGNWNHTPEYIESTGAAKITYDYSAKNVYMVSSSAAPMTIKILRDGKPLKLVTVSGEQLYDLIDGADYGAHTIEIDIPGAGLRAFTFTFG